MVKKKKKQKVKPNFMNVMGRGAGGALVETEIPFGQAMSDFGEPIIEFLSSPVIHDDEQYMFMIRESMEITAKIWNAAANGREQEAVSAIEDTKYSKIFNAEKLVGAMFVRFDEMFPSFRDPSERGKATVRKKLGEHSFNIYPYLGSAFDESLREVAEEFSGSEHVSPDDYELIDYEEEIDKCPEDPGLRLDYAEHLIVEEQFEEALEQLQAGYETAECRQSSYIETDFIYDILECLSKLNRPFSSFPWRKEPVVMSATEFESKVCAYLAREGGCVRLSDALCSTIGKKFLDPKVEAVELIKQSFRMRVVEEESGGLFVELI